MKPFILIFTACLLMVACRNKNQDPVDPEDIAAPSSEEAIVRDNLKVKDHEQYSSELAIENEAASTAINPSLLQGNWQSLDDPKSFMAFMGELKIDTYHDGHTDAGSTFMLADACQGETGNTPRPEANRYLTIKDQDQCFYIVKLTNQSLELSLVGRGNTLRYKRAADLQ